LRKIKRNPNPKSESTGIRSDEKEREDLIEKAKRHKHRREGREEVESRASPCFSLCVQPKLPYRFPQIDIRISLSLSLPLPLLRANQVNILTPTFPFYI